MKLKRFHFKNNNKKVKQHRYDQQRKIKKSYIFFVLIKQI